MQVKTITTAAGVNEIDFGNDSSQSTAHFYWLKNLGDSTLYVSANPNPIAEKDDVAELPAKGAVSVETDEGKVYILGAGKVEIHRTNSKFCPFDWQSSGSGGGGGGSITVDSELSDTSTNPLQNKVTTAAIKEVNSTVETLEAAMTQTQENVSANTAVLKTKSDINHIHDISASGNPVVMDNLQGGVPFSEITVSGKNLLPFPYYDTTKTVNGVTYTVNDDGTITINGTSTGKSYFYFIHDVNAKIYQAGKYTISGMPKDSIIDLRVLNIDDSAVIANDFGTGASFELTKPAPLRIYLYFGAGKTLDNVIIYPQLELGDTATEYEPSIMGRELQVNVSGKNLLKYPYEQTTRTSYGITFTDNGDGSITASGTHDGGSQLSFFGFSPWWANTSGRRLFLPKGNTVTFRIMGLPDTYNAEIHAKKDSTSVDAITTVRGAGESAVKYTAEQDCYIACGIYGTQSSVGQAVNFTAYPQLELSDTATDYKPYHGSTTTITPDSNPYTVPNDIRQQEGYNVISVSEGELSVIGVQKNAAIGKLYTDLKPVAFSGSYIDLSDKPETPINSDVTASGNPVSMGGLQGGAPFSEITVSGKNLLTYPYNETTKTVNGITFTDNGDGSIAVQGTATARSVFWLKHSVDNFVLPKNTPIYISAAKEQIPNVNIGYGRVNGTTWVTANTIPVTGAVVTFDYENFDRIDFNITVDPGSTIDVTLYPQFELGDTATAYEPPITSQEVTITRCGKNLLNVHIPTKREYVVNNTTFTINDDGSVSAISTETEKTVTRLSLSMTCLPGDYMFSGSADKDFCTYIYNRTKNTVTAWANPNPVPCRIEKENEYGLYFMVRENGKANGNVCKPQLELGDTATEYEPYHADTISITPPFNPYTIQNDLLQYNDINTLIASIGELKVVGVQKNAAVKKVWDEFASNAQRIDELDTTVNTTLPDEIEMLKAEIEELRALIKTT